MSEGCAAMKITLHIGAHRTGSTSFQRYMRHHQNGLLDHGVAFWGPQFTRNGVLRNLSHSGTVKASSKIKKRVRRTIAREVWAQHLVISDENLMGTCRNNLRTRQLYPDIGPRLSRVCAAFGKIDRIVLQIRTLDHWWASAIAFLMARGVNLPGARGLRQIALQPRSWRHVIAELAQACPESQILVSTFERFGPYPDHLMRAVTYVENLPDVTHDRFWCNRTPGLIEIGQARDTMGKKPVCLPVRDGGFAPFDETLAKSLRQSYLNDIIWLMDGADGCATLIREPLVKSSTPRLATSEPDDVEDVMPALIEIG